MLFDMGSDSDTLMFLVLKYKFSKRFSFRNFEHFYEAR